MSDNDFATRADVVRVESKVDRVYEAVERLIRIEERQEQQGARIGALEQRAAAIETAQAATDRKVEMWVNRMLGAWAVIGLVWAAFQYILKPH